jgi:hypothetical protein
MDAHGGTLAAPAGRHPGPIASGAQRNCCQCQRETAGGKRALAQPLPRSRLVPVKGILFFDWAVTGLPPTSSTLRPAAYPGTVLGQNSFGKSALRVMWSGLRASPHVRKSCSVFLD